MRLVGRRSKEGSCMWKFWKKKKNEDELEEREVEGVTEGTSEEEAESEKPVESTEAEEAVEAEVLSESEKSVETVEIERLKGLEESVEPIEEVKGLEESAEILEEVKGLKESVDPLEEVKGPEKSKESTKVEESEKLAEEEEPEEPAESEEASEEPEEPTESEEAKASEESEKPAKSEEAEVSEESEELEETEEAEEAAPVKEKKGFFARLREGLAKTRDNIARGFDRLFTANEIDDDFYEELEEILIMGDIGVNATTEIIDRLKAQVKERHLKKPVECKELLIQSIREQMEVGEAAYDFETQQSIIMVIGVNGVGKTTTVGKLAWKLKDDGKKVLIAAADTFRAAAGDQLAEWARRAGVPMIGGKEGADPASVVYDAVNAAKARGVDVLLVDTAGRLHNKKNLMEELRKMNRIIDKEYPNAHRENLIVLDGTTGQNALAQAREFGDVTNLTGIVLTKMDGTAKGGIAVAIQSELGIPVKYIGVGETTQDLQKFNPDDFVRALFDVDLTDHSVIAGADAPENMEDDL